jgi:hypothetical protein
VCVILPFTAARAAASADEVYARAERADLELRFADALASYDEAIALDPAHRLATQARARAASLREHAEGAFAPLVALERVRRDPALARDPDAIDALAQAADHFPEGLVRVEALLLCAEADARRLGRDDAALPLADKVLHDPRADGLARTEAARIIADVSLSRGDFERALTAVSVEGVAPDFALRVRRAARRHRLSLVATAVAFAWVLASTWMVLRAPRRTRDENADTRAATTRKTIQLSAAVGAAIACAGLVAGTYEGATPRPFFWLGGSVAFVGAASALVGARTGKWRAARSIGSALAVVAAAFLALYATGPDYLEDFGL